MSEYNKYVVDGKVNEEDIYRDAWSIADPGSSNPVAIAGTLKLASSALLHSIGTDGVKNHPALKVMAGQISALYKVSALGADVDDYGKVMDVVDSLNGNGDMPCSFNGCKAKFDNVDWNWDIEADGPEDPDLTPHDHKLAVKHEEGTV